MGQGACRKPSDTGSRGQSQAKPRTQAGPGAYRGEALGTWQQVGRELALEVRV